MGALQIPFHARTEPTEKPCEDAEKMQTFQTAGRSKQRGVAVEFGGAGMEALDGAACLGKIDSIRLQTIVPQGNVGMDDGDGAALKFGTEEGILVAVALAVLVEEHLQGLRPRGSRKWRNGCRATHCARQQSGACRRCARSASGGSPRETVAVRHGTDGGRVRRESSLPRSRAATASSSRKGNGRRAPWRRSP